MPITHTPLGRGAHAGSTRSHERAKPDSIQRPVLLRTHPGTAVRLRPLLAMLAARQMKRTRKSSPSWSQRPDMFPLHDVEYLRCMRKQATKLFERTRLVGKCLLNTMPAARAHGGASIRPRLVRGRPHCASKKRRKTTRMAKPF